MAYDKEKLDSEDNREIINLVESHIDDSLGYISTETSKERQTALEYYMREPYGNEVEGRSQIVTGEVAEVVDGSLPSILKVFTQSNNAVVFEPVNEGDAEMAEQATMMANHVFYKDNNGFEIMHDWFWDALCQKIGVTKCYFDEKKDTTIEKYENLTEDELTMIMQDDEVEVVEQEEVEEIVEQEQQPAMDQMGQPMIDEMGQPVMMDTPPIINIYYNIKCKRTKDHSKIKIENVAPEEFLIDKRATTIQDADFVAQRKLVTRSDLIAMGYDKDLVYTLETGDTLDFTPERVARYGAGESPFNTSDTNDESMEVVEYYECYVRTDQDDDGIAELHRICYASNTLLASEECDYIPFHSVCPFPIPHKFFGQSLADRAIDLQLIKSTITRQMLDNLYLTNNYRVGAVEGQVNLDDLLTSTAGGVVRIKNPNALVPMAVASQGLDPNILQNVTATAVSAMSNAAGGKLELIARVFADTGVSSLMKGILHLLCKYQDKERIIKVNNKYVPMNPREWDSEYNVTVNVGLGTGSKTEQLGVMQMVLQKQEQMLQQYGLANPLVSIKQYRDTLAKFVNMAGFKDESGFIKDLSEEQSDQLAQQQAQNPQTDPNTEAAKILAQVEKEKADLQAQTQMAKVEMDRKAVELKAQREMLEMQQKQVQFEKEMALKEMQLAQKAQNDKENTDLNKTKEIMNSLEKIQNMAAPKL